MRRDDQIAAAVTGTFALFFAIPDAAFVVSLLVPIYSQDAGWILYVIALLSVLLAAGVGIWTAMKHPGIAALWYLGWTAVLLLQLVVIGAGVLVIVTGPPAVILLVAAVLAWRASRRPQELKG